MYVPLRNGCETGKSYVFLFPDRGGLINTFDNNSFLSKSNFSLSASYETRDVFFFFRATRTAVLNFCIYPRK